MTKPVHIIYIDDDPDDIFLVKDVVESIHDKELILITPNSVVELLENPPPEPSLILVDLHMPKVNGIEILSKIRDNPSFDNIPVIMVSTGPSPVIIREARENGANLFMLKQPSMSLLEKSIIFLTNIQWRDFKATDEDFVYSPS